jgi:hypothetical protein
MPNHEVIKQQLQEDVLTILEGFGVDKSMGGQDYDNMATALCDAIIYNLNNLTHA